MKPPRPRRNRGGASATQSQAAQQGWIDAEERAIHYVRLASYHAQWRLETGRHSGIPNSAILGCRDDFEGPTLICRSNNTPAHTPIKHDVPGNRCAGCVPNSFIVHYLGRQAHDGLLGHLSERPTWTKSLALFVQVERRPRLHQWTILAETRPLGPLARTVSKGPRKSPPQTSQNKRPVLNNLAVPKSIASNTPQDLPDFAGDSARCAHRESLVCRGATARLKLVYQGWSSFFVRRAGTICGLQRSRGNFI